MTPIFWTRRLHQYEEFDAPYSGYVALLDGHVEYVESKPNKTDSRIIEIFGPNSEYSKAIRILEHVPPSWTDKELAPLPIRYKQSQRPRHKGILGLSIELFGPPLIAAALVAILPKPYFGERLKSAFIAFAIVLIATLILATTIC